MKKAVSLQTSQHLKSNLREAASRNNTSTSEAVCVLLRGYIRGRSPVTVRNDMLFFNDRHRSRMRYSVCIEDDILQRLEQMRTDLSRNGRRVSLARLIRLGLERELDNV